jgi:hypothetical protein
MSIARRGGRCKGPGVAVNRKVWVLYGALTDVGYTITAAF